VKHYFSAEKNALELEGIDIDKWVFRAFLVILQVAIN
jgi:hypothetical protein